MFKNQCVFAHSIAKKSVLNEFLHKPGLALDKITFGCWGGKEEESLGQKRGKGGFGVRMGGWAIGWVDGWVGGWVRGWMCVWLDEWVGEWMGG